jgi:hypothetical protein
MKIKDASTDQTAAGNAGGPRIVPKKGPRIVRDAAAPKIVRPSLGGAR